LNLKGEGTSLKPSLVFIRTFTGLRMTIRIYTRSLLSSWCEQNLEMLSNLISSWYVSNYPSSFLLVKETKRES
jgi:hypothetical protein